jgi:hypothetical protein
MPNRRRTTTLGAAGLAAVTLLALVGCAGGPSGDDVTAGPTETVTVPPPTTPAPTPSDTPAPTPTETDVAAPLVTIPTDCTQIVDGATYAATFGSTPLNPEGFVRRDGTPRGSRTPSVPEAGAQPFQIADAAAELDCLWRDPGADVTGIGVILGRLDQPTAASMLQQAEAEGGTCSTAHQGRICQQTTVHEMYGTDTTSTYFVRGDLYVVVTQSNFPTNDLLGSVLARLES